MSKKILVLLVLINTCVFAQRQPLRVIGYFSGKADQVDALPAEKLSHVIYSFCHLKGNELAVDSEAGATTIQKLVDLKKRNANLKVILSLGGWGGCAPCSDVFSLEKGRADFSASVRKLCDQFKADGIDLDWEYPAIEGHPGHAFKTDDRKNFTLLVQSLRAELGNSREISFAAGGFKKFLDESIEWDVVMPLVDRVNLMSYDLVNGYSTVTGHHTPLYSSKQQPESTDFAVQYLAKKGVPKNKLVIGAAFYARVWENVANTNNGLYQTGKFKQGVNYKKFPQMLSDQQGFTDYWDSETQSPYKYNAAQKLFATFDDKKSVRLKTEYALKQGLDGIMFWELTLDDYSNGLLSEIASTVSLLKK